ncbi:MAG: hypothetical protein ACREJC_19920, partial [Tepidisphaeraceae bacterium]
MPGKLITVVGLALVFALRCGGAEPNLSDPKSAAATFFGAINSGDQEVIKQSCTGSEQQLGYILALADLLSSQKELRDLAHQKFGAAVDRVPAMVPSSDYQKRLDESQIDIQDDTATITGKDKRSVWKLLRFDGKWRVDLGTLASTSNTGKVPEMLAMATASRELIAELKANKHPSAQAYIEALK